MAKDNQEALSVSIAFRVHPSVQNKALELKDIENLKEAELYRRIFNAGLKTIYGVDVRGNKVIN